MKEARKLRGCERCVPRDRQEVSERLRVDGRVENVECGESERRVCEGGDAPCCLVECRVETLELFSLPLCVLACTRTTGPPGVNTATASMKLHYKIDEGRRVMDKRDNEFVSLSMASFTALGCGA